MAVPGYAEPAAIEAMLRGGGPDGMARADADRGPFKDHRRQPGRDRRQPGDRSPDQLEAFVPRVPDRQTCW